MLMLMNFCQISVLDLLKFLEVANAYVQVGSGKVVGNASIKTLNRSIQQDSNITKYFKERCDENKVLFKDLKQNILDENFNEYMGSLKNLKDNINFLEQQRTISKNLIVLTKTFKSSEKDDVSNLKIALDNVHLTLEEYELLILIKYRSNCEFHGNRYQI
ncbi:hypothetical protein RhiirA4_457590 [Rhizophagus irregularis]|uniref:Uncharacterized protein n=1 Tax=Rhizophagus irregularis TaxID=588596 RepID=A0A2I1GAE6_9GLOM|nr:hypothetical protein RhiirA4_457590 [Rhizophagus irregularis]